MSKLCALILMISLACARPCVAQAPVIVYDFKGDAVSRRTDIGADGPIARRDHRLPDVILYRIGAWQPSSPAEDLYEGDWDPNGDFFRLDVRFAGLVNPPGSLGLQEPFDPYRYGEHPVFGYIEVDMDGDPNTGGELNRPDLRYLGSVARFGGVPVDPRFRDRVATDGSAFDNDITTRPFVDRSGEEFHLALFGFLVDQISIEGDDDPNDANDPNGQQDEFEPGAAWRIRGRFFHRAHGYEPFSFACCDGLPGSYEPEVELRFSHDDDRDRTTVSLVYPLTNAGSAVIEESEEVEPNDGDASNQNSVLEGLDDLRFSAQHPLPGWDSDPRFSIIRRWQFGDPAANLDPRSWKITIAVATSYTTPDPDGALFVWTDVLPDVIRGDLNGDRVSDRKDRQVFDSYLSLNDGLPGMDADGVVNGEIHIPAFAENFSLFDVNYDGVVDATDREGLRFPSSLGVSGGFGKIPFP